MKTRRSLLFGLGILVTLSFATPTLASGTDGLSDSGLTVLADETDEGSDGVGTENDESAQANQAYTWEQSEDGTWILNVDGEPVTNTADGSYFYKIGADYFCINKAGELLTGPVTISDEVTVTPTEPDAEAETLSSGTYYFEGNGSEPGQDQLGKMLKDCWALDGETRTWYFLAEDGIAEALSDAGKTGWQQIDGKWYDLNKDGTWTEKTGWQQVDTEKKTWCYLAKDGSVDTTQNGLQETADQVWLNAEDGIAALAQGWQQVADNKWYYLKDGVRDTAKTGLQEINGKTYGLNNDGTVLSGLAKVGDQMYCFSEVGVLQEYTNEWKNIAGKLYYFNADHQVTTQNTTGWQKIDGSQYWLENGQTVTGWKQISGKWYYMDPSTGAMKTGFYTVSGKKYYSDSNGAMLEGGWHKINNTWYYMQPSGAVQTGWIKLSNTWYWLGTDGAMLTGWYTVNGQTYYSNASGAMQTGWLLLGGKWYYLQSSGAMAKGWILTGGKWYYLNTNGVMQTGWYKVGATWYYSNGSGAMQTGWVRPDGKTWYYLNTSGAMQTGWYKVGGTWYYSNSSGAMLTGWQKINNTWYYLTASGAMAANRWIDGYYYVNGSGAMVTSTWVGNYYVGSDGRWIPNYDPVTYGGKWVKQGGNWYFQTSDGAKLTNRWQKINGVWYWFDSNGVMATGWKYISGLKYYFNSSGALVQDLDSVIGRQSSYYITVNRVKCQVTVYAKDGANGYIIPVKTFACSVGMPSTPTPTGTYRTPAKYRWHELMGPSYGQYCTRIVGGVLFHSVAGSNMTSYNLSAGEYNKLGSPASHGCVRLCVRDAKWIYDNCALGTTVRIGDNEIATPFDKPATIKIPASQNWDPTDPNI